MTKEEEFKLISLLRKYTGNGMIACKKALEKFNWDVEEARNWLKTQPIPGRILYKDNKEIK